MCTHLHKRGSTYYFRRVIPESLRPWFNGKAEWTYTLHTKDRDQGKRRAACETVKTDEAIAALERRIAAGERPPSIFDTASPADAEHLSLTPEALARANALTAEETAREDRRVAREPYRREIEARFKRSTTAELSPREAAMRDLLRDREYDPAIANDRALIARAAPAEVTAPAIASTESSEPSAPAAPTGVTRVRSYGLHWSGSPVSNRS